MGVVRRGYSHLFFDFVIAFPLTFYIFYDIIFAISYKLLHFARADAYNCYIFNKFG